MPFLRALENGLRDQIANRVGASGKIELDADLIEHKGHKVNLFLVEWHVLKDAIGRHWTSSGGPIDGGGVDINALPRGLFPVVGGAFYAQIDACCG
jgi:hypothetical protein